MLQREIHKFLEGANSGTEGREKELNSNITHAIKQHFCNYWHWFQLYSKSKHHNLFLKKKKTIIFKTCFTMFVQDWALSWITADFSLSRWNNAQFSETMTKFISAHSCKSELEKTFMSDTAILTTPQVPVYHLGQEAQVSWFYCNSETSPTWRRCRQAK